METEKFASEAKIREMELASEARKEEMELGFRKLKLKADTKSPNSDERNNSGIPVNIQSESSRSMPKFDAKWCDIIH